MTDAIKRGEKGQFLPGTAAGPGRPKGKTIKERVREYLEEHPDDMAAFVDHFVKENRDLAWQMLEGRPSQGIGQADDLAPLILPSSIIEKNDTPPITGSSS